MREFFIRVRDSANAIFRLHEFYQIAHISDKAEREFFIRPASPMPRFLKLGVVGANLDCPFNQRLKFHYDTCALYGISSFHHLTAPSTRSIFTATPIPGAVGAAMRLFAPSTKGGSVRSGL